MSQAQTIADEINKSLKGKAGTVEIWGLMPVRPDDSVYQVASAKAEGNRLDIAFDDEKFASVWDPGRFKMFPGEELPFFLVGDATRVRWHDHYDVADPAAK